MPPVRLQLAGVPTNQRIVPESSEGPHRVRPRQARATSSRNPSLERPRVRERDVQKKEIVGPDDMQRAQLVWHGAAPHPTGTDEYERTWPERCADGKDHRTRRSTAQAVASRSASPTPKANRHPHGKSSPSSDLRASASAQSSPVGVSRRCRANYEDIAAASATVRRDASGADREAHRPIISRLHRLRGSRTATRHPLSRCPPRGLGGPRARVEGLHVRARRVLRRRSWPGSPRRRLAEGSR